MTTGIITTTSGVLFMKAETPVTTSPSSDQRRAPAGRRHCARPAAMTISSAPVRTSPPMTRNITAMVQGAGFDSTAGASLHRQDAQHQHQRRPADGRHLDRVGLAHEQHEHADQDRPIATQGCDVCGRIQSEHPPPIDSQTL